MTRDVHLGSVPEGLDVISNRSLYPRVDRVGGVVRSSMHANVQRAIFKHHGLEREVCLPGSEGRGTLDDDPEIAG